MGNLECNLLMKQQLKKLLSLPDPFAADIEA